MTTTMMMMIFVFCSVTAGHGLVGSLAPQKLKLSPCSKKSASAQLAVWAFVEEKATVLWLS